MIRNILIIYPHWHPVNLAGVHRPRLIANSLLQFGWQPHVITVNQRYFEERPDRDFELTFSKKVEVTRVSASKITKPRLIGDVGLRAFVYLYKGALKIIKTKKIDFIWIPVPSFYTGLLGRFLYHKTMIPYGIDYIDPWVRDISTRKDWRHKISNWLARTLEPIAVKNASLITGVSFEYYKPVLERNFRRRTLLPVTEQSVQPANFASRQFKHSTDQPINHTAFPYGFDPNDHNIKLKNIQYPWSGRNEGKPWIYAGAFLPNSRLFVKLFFLVIAGMRESGMWDNQIRLYFIGTGAYSGKSIVEYANEAGIKDHVIEDRNRHPYLHVLNFLSAADTVMVIGSTEKHYTASKVFQALLSEQPVWAIFHKESSAVKVMEECHADQSLVKYEEEMPEEALKDEIKRTLLARLNSKHWNPDLKALEKYSARESARKLVEGMERVLSTEV